METSKFSIDSFAERAKSLLHSVRNDSSIMSIINPFALTDATAEAVLKAAFYASMVSDEGRLAVVKLVPIESPDTKSLIEFAPFVDVEARNIAKLAHTVTHSSALAFGEQNGKPVIFGILPPKPVRLGTYLKQEARTMAQFNIAIKGPGKIDVISRKGVLTYNAGVMSEFHLLLSCKLLERLGEQMDTCVLESLGEEFNQQMQFDIASYLATAKEGAIKQIVETSLSTNVAPDAKCKYIIAELIREIADLEHGGMLIVSNRPESSILNYKYSIKRGGLHDSVASFFKTAYDDGYGTFRKSKIESPGHALMREAVVLSENISATARLASTDGAIVLGMDCKLHGFGAIIDKANEDVSQVELKDGKGSTISIKEILHNKGSRHQSALSFAMREKGTVVFVVSQDGNVTALENQNGTVVVEKGLRAEGL